MSPRISKHETSTPPEPAARSTQAETEILGDKAFVIMQGMKDALSELHRRTVSSANSDEQDCLSRKGDGSGDPTMVSRPESVQKMSAMPGGK